MAGDQGYNDPALRVYRYARIVATTCVKRGIIPAARVDQRAYHSLNTGWLFARFVPKPL